MPMRPLADYKATVSEDGTLVFSPSPGEIIKHYHRLSAFRLGSFIIAAVLLAAALVQFGLNDAGLTSNLQFTQNGLIWLAFVGLFAVLALLFPKRHERLEGLARLVPDESLVKSK